MNREDQRDKSAFIYQSKTSSNLSKHEIDDALRHFKGEHKGDLTHLVIPKSMADKAKIIQDHYKNVKVTVAPIKNGTVRINEDQGI